MAKQIGIIRLKGTIGDTNFYSTPNGGDLARTAGGGFNSNDIKKKDTMVRVRENASEFGHCSKVKKAFRVSLAPFLCVRKDGSLHSRMMTLFTKIKSMDRVSRRGNRTVGKGLETPLGLDLIYNFVFTPACNVIDTIGASASYDFGIRSCGITNFDIKNVSFPSGATHMALSLGLLHFDFNTLTYKLKMSTPLYIDKAYGATFFELSVEDPEVAGMQIAVLGLKFYQEVKGTYYLFKSANAVGVEVLGVEG
ncbi:MAG: hypothetical protein V7655_04450 [Aequorivita antarctica]